MKKIKRWLILLFVSIFGKAEPEHKETARTVKPQQVEAPDEWSLLLQDMQSPDFETRERAQATWRDKRSRDTAFFDGMTLYSTKKPSERGLPMHVRAGWGADSNLPPDRWADDKDWSEANVNQVPTVDHYEEVEFRQIDHKYKQRKADELDLEFYGTRPENITKDDLEKTASEYRHDARDESQESFAEETDRDSQGCGSVN